MWLSFLKSILKKNTNNIPFVLKTHCHKICTHRKCLWGIQTKVKTTSDTVLANERQIAVGWGIQKQYLFLSYWYHFLLTLPHSLAAREAGQGSF